MKLFVNGCSFTWGSGIIEQELIPNHSTPPMYTVEQDLFRQKQVYAHRLHTKLKTEELVNLGEGASSNTRIVRKTLDFFIDRLNKNLPVNDYLAVIQWTSTPRYEICDGNDRWISVFPGGVVPLQLPERKAVLEQRMTEHPINFTLDWHRNIICLSSFFNQHKIKYLFATLPIYQAGSTFELPDGYYKNSINWLGDSPETNQVLTDHRHVYPCQHPSLEGHRLISEALHRRLIALYKL